MPTRAPTRKPECAVTFAPRPCASSTTARTSSVDQGASSFFGPSRYSLRKSAPSSSCVDAAFKRAGPSSASIARPPVRTPLWPIHVPATLILGRFRSDCHRARTRRARARFRPSRGSTASGDPTSRAQRTPARPRRSPLCSATSSSSSGGSAPRSIQCEPPGSVTWLWASTMPGTIVEPPASMTWTSGGRSPSSALGRIQTMRSASARRLTPFRSDDPVGSARAASRYKVGGGMIIETPSSSVSRWAFKEGVAEPDQRHVRLEPLRLREERPEPRVAVVLLVGLVIRGDDVKEIILNAASLFASADRADEASLEEPTPVREVLPDRDFLGLEHRFEIFCLIGGDSKDNRRRLRCLDRGDTGFPRHALTMLEGLLKSKAAAKSGRNRQRVRARQNSPGPYGFGLRAPGVRAYHYLHEATRAGSTVS